MRSIFFLSHINPIEAGRRSRKRRRGWGGNRTSKLGGGEQLRLGELLADEEEELEKERLNEMERKGGSMEVEGMCGAGVKEELEERMEGVGWTGLVKKEPRETVVKAEMAEVGGSVKEEMELDVDAFSDDDLL